MQEEIESTLDQIGLNIVNWTLENPEKMGKLELLIWKDGTFCDHLWSATMLSVIFDINQVKNYKW